MIRVLDSSKFLALYKKRQSPLPASNVKKDKIAEARAAEINEHIIEASQVVIVVKNPLVSAGDIRDTGSIPGLGRSPGVGHGNPFLYSCLEPHGLQNTRLPCPLSPGVCSNACPLNQ